MNSIILDNFKNLVDFLGMVLGKNAEVVLHELSDFDHSILAISNNLSGREVGGPLTDYKSAALVLEKMIEGEGGSCSLDFQQGDAVTETIVCVSSVVIMTTLGLSLFKRMKTEHWIGMIVFFALGFIYWVIRIKYLKAKKDKDLVKDMKGLHPYWLELENKEEK